MESGAHAGVPELSLQQEGSAGDVCLARRSGLEPSHHSRKDNDLLNLFIPECIYSHLNPTE